MCGGWRERGWGTKVLREDFAFVLMAASYAALAMHYDYKPGEHGFVLVGHILRGGTMRTRTALKLLQNPEQQQTPRYSSSKDADQSAANSDGTKAHHMPRSPLRPLTWSTGQGVCVRCDIIIRISGAVLR